MLEVAAIIPARFYSTRFTGKPLANIDGKPMIEWTYKQALKAKVLQKVVVATDDERIFIAVKKFGGEAYLTSKKHSSGTDRVAEVARKLNFSDDGIVVNIQGDEPLIQPIIINQLVSPLLREKDLQMTTLIYRIKKKEEIRNPNIVKVALDRKGYALYFSRSLIPYTDNISGKAFYKHIGIYAYRKGFLLKFSKMSPTPLEKLERLEQLRALENGYRIKTVLSRFDPVEVDTPDDITKVAKELRVLRRKSLIKV